MTVAGTGRSVPYLTAVRWGEGEVHDVASLDRAHGRELDRLAAGLAEEPRAPSEEQRRDMDVHRVEETRSEVLLGHVCAAGDPDIEVACRSLRLLER
jgi:hypothetical protein